MTIALIGAGGAGAACVSVLRSRGADFCIFEKSRGVGGRLCTRRVSEVVPNQTLFFDHGCPSFELTDDLRDKLSHIAGPHTLKQLNDHAWVSTPSMPQLIKELLGSASVKTQCEIDAVTGSPGEWYLVEKQTSTNLELPNRHGPFQKVILTAPAPQALNLLRNLEHTWAAPLSHVQYTASWVLMTSLRLEPETKFLPSQIFSSIRCQNLIPARPSYNGVSSWVASAHPEWSHSHLEKDPIEIRNILNKAFFEALDDARPEVLYSNVHRWRYAQVVQSLNTPFLSDSSRSLFYASDACYGKGIEGALSSGFELGTIVCDELR